MAVAFDTFTPLHGGLPGTAPAVFSATTDELAAALLAVDSVKNKLINATCKDRDIVFVNYNMAAKDATYGYFDPSAHGSGMYRVSATYSAAAAGVPPKLTGGTLILVMAT